MRLFLTLLIFLFNSFFAMTDKQTVENCYQECKKELQQTSRFKPNPSHFKLLLMHADGRDLIKKIAQQDFFWQERSKDLPLGWCPARPTLIHIIITSECEDSQTATILDIFLTTAKEMGHFALFDSKHFLTHILQHAIERNNIDCTKVLLAHDASLDITCFSMTDGNKYRPLEFACKEFGPKSKMIDVLLAHSATSKSAAYDLFGPLKK